jgi:hypothetical protein
MLIYRDGGRRVNSRAELARLRRAADAAAPSREAALHLLIEIGEFESAIADAFAPAIDGTSQTSAAARGLTEDAAAAWLALADGEDGGRARTSLLRRLRQFEAQRLPNSIELRVSEGYAYYALFPESYAASAARFRADTGAARVVAVGIRSIGTSLSAVVAGSLRASGCTVTSCTVRPHGHPFDRVLRIDSSLADLFREEASLGAWFAVVDEGPGLSGSSFASVITYLRSLEIPASRVALFASWEPDPATLKSETARRLWTEHPRYCAIPDRSRTPEAVFGIAGAAENCSAGRWRAALGAFRGGDPPPAHPQHERWKVLLPESRRMIRFAGLGPYGAAIERRARALAGMGLGEAPGELRSGFLDVPFVAGAPLTDCRNPEDAATIGRYIARVSRAFAVRQAADTVTLGRMIETNLGGIMPCVSIDPPADVPAAALDGRMLPHEWIRTDRGLVKVDALDHHADHFLPGPQSPAWDLAGAEIELGMSSAVAKAMVEAFARESGDRLAEGLLPFYRLAYAAFRFGYATLAAETLAGTDDALRFARAARVYSQCALKAAACCTASAKSPLKQMARSSMKT